MGKCFTWLERFPCKDSFSPYVLRQGKHSRERRESMNESTGGPIMGMNTCWPFAWDGELETALYSPALQLASVDPISK